MRLKVLQAHIASMKEKADIRKREPSLQDDEVLKPITRCFTSIEVSTNRSDVSKYVCRSLLFCFVFKSLGILISPKSIKVLRGLSALEERNYFWGGLSYAKDFAWEK